MVRRGGEEREWLEGCGEIEGGGGGEERGVRGEW